MTATGKSQKVTRFNVLANNNPASTARFLSECTEQKRGNLHKKEIIDHALSVINAKVFQNRVENPF